MKRKSLAMLLFAATLGLGSCNDIQDLNLNFGDRTYINDYKGLIDAVNNLNLSLKERFDALSQLLKTGIEDIKVSIDANTGAIKIVGQNIITLDGDIKDGLSAINTSIFDGFKAVCSQIDATGNTIVAAIDNNGNLLRLQIDKTGKLISAQMVTSTNDLIQAMKDNTASLADKLGLIDASIKAGFADEKDALSAINTAIAALKTEVANGNLTNKQAIEALTEVVKSLTASLEVKLAAIEKANKEGLATLAEMDNLINESIKALKAEVANGNLTNKQAIEALTEVVKSLTTSLETKLAAIETANKEGLATLAQKNDLMKGAIDALAAEVKAGNKSNADALAEIKDAITSQTTSLKTKLEAIETANKEGLATLAQKNDLINAAIAALNESVKSQTISIEKKLADIETATKNGLATLAEKNDLIDASIKALAAEVASGNLTNKQAIEALTNAVKSQTTSLETKLEAIETANKAGLATLADKNDLTKKAIDALAAEVKAGNTSEAKALEEIKKAIASQTTELSTKITAVTTAVTTGLANENSTIASMSSALQTAINNLKTEVQNCNTNNKTYLAQLVSGLTTLNGTMGTTNTKLGEIKDVLTKELADNGVTINPDGDGKSVLVTPDIWNDIEKAGATSQLYNTFMDAIKDVTVPKVVNPTQVTPGTWHTCARFVNDGYDENTVALRAGTLQPMTAANGKTVIKVIKTPSEVKFHITNLQNCTYEYLYNIRVYDARGDYQVYGGASGNETGSRATIGEATSRTVPTTKVSTANIILKAYDNGRICDEVKAYVFTYLQNTNPSGYGYGLPNLFWPSTPDPRP